MNKLTKAEYTYLHKIGLSKRAIELYKLLLTNGPVTAKDAGDLTNTFAAANYRLLYDLEDKGLVRRLSGRPQRFKALRSSDGLQSSLLKQEQELETLISRSVDSGNDFASILAGRQVVYDAYAKHASAAQDQLCVYSIGIAYSEKLAKTQAAAVKRGVVIRHVVQEVRISNYFVISRWLKLGIDLRHLKRHRGYHLTLIDDRVAIVTFSNPDDTEERVSLQTTNQAIIAIFQAQFEIIWQEAKVIPPELLG